MDHEAGVFLQPGFHFGSAMSSVVVHHDVQGFAAGKLAVNTPQKLQKLLMPVALVEIADDFALKQIEGGEQSC
ncbi:MAG: hypothetical protein QOJ99_1275, partial [Bryobacterales bacterium]|nr:hypothetical protein [Bryobacterales bacterium]